MEGHYLNTTYVSDLKALIFARQHDVIRALAKRDVLNQKKEDIIKECEPWLEKIKEYDNKEQLTEEEVKDREELKEKVVERWRFKLYYQDEAEKSEKDLVKFSTELNTLSGQLFHIELCHPNV